MHRVATRTTTLLALLVLVLSLGRGLGADPLPVVASATEQIDLLVADGLKGEVALGKLLADEPVATLAAAWCAVDLDDAAARQALANARADHADELTALVAADDTDALAAAFAGEGELAAGVAPDRLLAALRFWQYRRERESQSSHACTIVELARGLGLTDAVIAERLVADFPRNRLPETTPTEVTGRLETIAGQDGVQVLTVWGTPFERGYAHGKLLGSQIITLWKRYAIPVATARAGYDRIAQFQDLVFDVPADLLDEMKGMLIGIRESVPADVRCDNPLGRDIALVDLKVANSLSDWAQFGCSSVTVWGDLTGGPVLSARNLDFPRLDGALNTHHLILIHAPAPADGDLPDRPGWVSITWPGLIGCYTGVRSDGVSAMMHDSRGRYHSTVGVVPRGLSQRRALELADVTDMPGSFVRALRPMQHLVASNIHVAWPGVHADRLGPAAAIELDGLHTVDSGVTVRRAERAGLMGYNEYVAVTNHFCARYAHDSSTGAPGPSSDSTRRLSRLQAALGDASDGSVDRDRLIAWLQSVGKVISVHSVLINADTRDLWVMLPGPDDDGAPWVDPVHLSLDDVFAGVGEVVGAADGE